MGEAVHIPEQAHQTALFIYMWVVFSNNPACLVSTSYSPEGFSKGFKDPQKG